MNHTSSHSSNHAGETEKIDEVSCGKDDVTNSSNRPSIFKRIWKALGLDLKTAITMVKGAMPPVIALASYQSSSWDRKFTTLGYLVAIVATLGMAIMPRAKFTQTTLLNIVWSLLAVFYLRLLTTIALCVCGCGFQPPSALHSHQGEAEFVTSRQSKRQSSRCLRRSTGSRV